MVHVGKFVVIQSLINTVSPSNPKSALNETILSKRYLSWGMVQLFVSDFVVTNGHEDLNLERSKYDGSLLLLCS